MRNFDTLESFERLKDAGVSEKQARVFVKMVEESVNASIENLATKADLALTKAELKIEIAEVRTEIAVVRTEMAEMKTELKGDIRGLQSSMILMQRLFFGGTVAILLSIAALFLHHPVWLIDKNHIFIIIMLTFA